MNSETIYNFSFFKITENINMYSKFKQKITNTEI